MEQKFVDDFFYKGIIRLSNFATFAQHKDEERGDKGEGHVLSVMTDPEANKSMAFYSMTGSNAYVLSVTSSTGSDISKAFGGAHFEIFEPIGFCLEVMNEIPGCTEAMIGHCIYSDNRVLVTTGKVPAMGDLKSELEPNKMSLATMLAHDEALSGPKQYFLKTKKHEWQSEYRFVWETNKKIEGPLLVTAPNLKRYCRFNE